MSVCVPKHVVCGTYVPDFTPGNEPCTLQSFNETRAILGVVGVFFRSIDVGAQNNLIQLSCEWQKEVPPLSGTWVQTSVDDECERVEVIITDGTTTETYYADQYGSLSIIPPFDFEWTANAVSSLETQINSASILVRMNITDTQQPWPETPPPAQPDPDV